MTDIEAMRNVLADYGMTLNDEGFFLRPDGKSHFPLKAARVKNRVQVRHSGSNSLYFTGPFPQGIGSFVERFWYKERIK